MRFVPRRLALLVTPLMLVPVSSAAGQASGRSVPGELIVRFEASADAGDRAEARDDAHVDLVRKLRLPRAQLVEVEAGQSVDDALAELRRQSGVTFAEHNAILHTYATPNDSRIADLWGMSAIDAPRAWDFSTGDRSVTVAIADTGVAYDHPDLASNIWSNDDPIGGGDDDGNGFVDDLRGWDFVEDDNDPRDYDDHGTHVAGTVGAVGNNGLGVVGVGWATSLMPVRVLGTDGSGSADKIADGFDYAADNGADVVNASLGGPGGRATMQAVIEAHPETLFVVAAGNDEQNNDAPNTDTYPCDITSANLICVAATNQADGLAEFSNYGATSVDLAAPGQGILSTVTHLTTGTTSLDSFEGTLAGWTQGGSGGTFAATASPTLPYDDAQPGTYFTGPTDGTKVLDDSPTVAGYSSNEDFWIRSNAAVGGSASLGCVLLYDIRHDLEPGDRLYVEASADGSAWTIREQFTAYRAAWNPAATYLGDIGPAYVRFRLDADTDTTQEGYQGSSPYDGVQIDDLRYRCLGTAYDATDYWSLSGTSMAAPHVSGAAAVLLAAHPNATALELRSWLESSGEPLGALAGKTATGKRLNLADALAAAAPTATTGAATGVAARSATLNGRLDPGGSATEYRFEWGPTPAYGNSAPSAPASAGSGSDPVAVSTALSGLSPRTTYHFRLVALQAGRISGLPGADMTFTTGAEPQAPPPAPPSAAESYLGTDNPTVVRPPTGTLPAQSVKNAARYRIVCASRCSGTATLRVRTTLARRLGLRTFTVGVRSISLSAGSSTVTVPIRRAVLRKLRARGIAAPRLQLAITLTDAAGHRRTLSARPIVPISRR